MGAFGAFGKIPALGDFFRQNVSGAFVEPWDRWVQGAMVAARGALGGRWQECYFSAPIWRFSLTAGLAGPGGALGVLMPSVDRVGRQFPLTLVMPLPAGRAAVQAHLAARPTFEALEVVALRTLEEDLRADRLAQALSAVAAPAPPRGGRATEVAGAVLLASDDAGGPAPALAAHLCSARYRAPSVWSADLYGTTRLMVAEGLPGRTQAPALFDSATALWQPQGDPAR